MSNQAKDMTKDLHLTRELEKKNEVKKIPVKKIVVSTIIILIVTTVILLLIFLISIAKEAIV